MVIFKCQKGAEKYVAPIIEKLKSPTFFAAAQGVSGFESDFTDPDGVTGQDILKPLFENDPVVYIGFYKQNWFSYRVVPVNAYVPAEGGKIFLNIRQLWRDQADIEETMWHELVHISDSLNKRMIYWHGENNLKGKENTAPVKFAKWAANFYV